MRTSILRGRRYSAISSKLLLSGVFFISFFGAIGYFALDAPARADSLVAPSTPAPVDGGVVNGQSYVQTWSAVPGAAKYEYKSFNDANGLLPRVTIFYTSPIKPTYNIPDNTIYWWKVRAVDSAGAVGSWSPLWKAIVDNVAPTTTLTASAPAAAPNLYNTPVTITGTVGAAEKNLASHTFTVTNPNGTTATIGPVSTANVVHSFTLDTSAGDGAYTVAYSATDKAGNKSAAIAPVTVVIDTTAPDAPQLTGAGSRTMKSGDAVHTWAPSTATDLKNYIFKRFNSEADAAAPATAAAAHTATLPKTQTSYTRATGTPDGTYWYRVAAVDTTGNISWSPQTYSVTVDDTAPVAPVVTIAGFASGGVTKQTDHTISWSTASSDAVSYDFQYWSDAPGAVYTAAAPFSVTGTPDLAWSGTFTEGDGTYSVRARATDGVGNVSDWSAVATVRIDTQAPHIALAPLASSLAPATLTVTGTIADLTVKEVVVSLGADVRGTVPVVNGAFSYEFTGLGVGNHIITVRGVDEAGVEGVASVIAVVTAPVVPVVPAAPAASPASGATGAAARTAAPTPAATAAAQAEALTPSQALEATSPDDTLGESTNAGQETKGAADSRVNTGDLGGVWLTTWLGWIVAFIMASGWFWWLVAGRRRRRDEE